jgi:hypothetical protein
MFSQFLPPWPAKKEIGGGVLRGGSEGPRFRRNARIAS